MKIQIESVAEPFDRQDVAEEAMSVISTASAMGLLEGLQLQRLDRPSFRQVVDRLAEAGIGREVSPMFAASASPEIPGSSMKGVLRRLATALEESPVPTSEWPALESLLETPLCQHR